MIISLTSIKLKSIWKFFPLSYNAMNIIRQTKNQPGFVSITSRGFGYDHYTLSVWDDENSLQQFARSGAHFEAMKKSRSLATEIRTYTYSADTIPEWKTAKTLLRDKGKLLSFR